MFKRKYLQFDYMDDDQWQYHHTKTTWGYRLMISRMVNGKVVCTVCIGQWNDRPEMEGMIYALATDHRYHHQGHATETLKHALEVAGKLGIMRIGIEPDSKQLADWYKKFGFIWEEEFMVLDKTKG